MAGDKKEDSKVFDVAKPSDAKKDIGSKPMIIGHKPLAEDPMVKEKPAETKEAEPAEEEVKEKVAPPSVSKKVITPPSEKEAEEEQKPEQQSSTSKEGSPSSTKEDSAEEDEEKPGVDPEVEKNERNEKLQKMVDSKKYFVTVHESSGSHTKTFVITFILALLVGLIAVALLIDAEVLDVGVSLPFDLL